MASVRLSLGLCIVMVLGAIAALPAAVTAQEEQVTLTVTVVDQEGNTVGSVPVSATWDDGNGGPVNATTAANGRAFIDVPAGANVTIYVNDDEYIRNSPYTGVTDATTRDVNVSVSQAATATISVNDTNGNAVDDARVLLRRSGTFVTNQRTGDDGTVTTPAVEEGDYTLYVQKSGYYYTTTGVTITGEDTLNQTIEEGTVNLQFNVTDDRFQPPEAVQSASVEISPIGTTLQTLSGGQASTDVPVNTEYDITVSKDGYTTTEETVTVQESGTTANITINRAPELNINAPNQTVIGQSVELEVTDEYGDAVEGATITQNGESVGTTDSNGELDVSPQTAGVVNYTVSSGDTSATVSIEVFDPDATDMPSDLTATPDATDEPEGSFGAGPGFTPVTVVAAVALLSLLAYRRR